MTELPRPEGHIVTFYSYKGGTGRSMALANVAWILASNGKRVLVIDWDLEAPGVHRYFHPFLRDKNLSTSEGLIDFVIDYVGEAHSPPPDAAPLEKDWYKEHANITNFAESLRYSQFPKPGTIDLVPAGRQSASYASAVNLFNWQHFYEKLGGEAFFEAAKEYMRADYDYILIDSRTGVSDTAGICTVQMPETVVILFTLNIQSLEGASSVAESIESQRRARNTDVRILPVPTRVDRSEKEKVEVARIEAWKKFDRFLWNMTGSERADYWSAVEIPHEAWYSFEEMLATFGDRTRRLTSMLSAMETLTSYITKGEVTRFQGLTEAERATILAQYVRRRSPEEDAARPDAATRGERALARLSAAQQKQALDVITRLVYVSGDSTLVTRSLEMHQLGDVPDRVMQALRYAEIVSVENAPDGTPIVSLTSSDVISDWSRAKRVIEADRAFLVFRQRLTDDAAEYRRGSDRSVLLRGQRLAEAETQFAKRPDDFSRAERRLISASGRRRWLLRTAALFAAVLPLVAWLAIRAWHSSDSYQIERVREDAPLALDEKSPKAGDAIADWIRALVRAKQDNEAQRVVRSRQSTAQRAFASAVLNSALAERDLSPQAIAAVQQATKTVDEIPSTVDRIRTQIAIANVLPPRFRETSTRLLLQAFNLASLSTTESSRDDSPNLLAKNGQERFDLLADLALGLQAVQSRRTIDAVHLLTRDRGGMPADLISRRAISRSLLDLASQLDGLPGGTNAAVEARAGALHALSEPGMADDFARAAKSLLENGDARSSALLVTMIGDAPFLRSRQSDLLKLVLDTDARFHRACDEAFWSDTRALLSHLADPYPAMLRPHLAAAFAGCGDRETALALIKEPLSAVSKAHGPGSAGARAEILAGLSEAEFRLGGSVDQSRLTRQRAIEQARIELDPTFQSEAFMAIAVAAARSRDVLTAVDIAALARDRVVLQQRLPEVIEAIAAAAEFQTDPAVSDIPPLALRAVEQLAAKEDRDDARKGIVLTLSSLLKPRPALEIARSIESESAKYEAIEKIFDIVGSRVSLDDVARMAGTFQDPRLRTLTFLKIAQQHLSRGSKALALKAINDAADECGPIADGTDKSDAYRRVANAYADCDDLVRARRAAIACSEPADRLRAYAAILNAWAKQKEPAPSTPRT
ncbi:MAG: hypothetical protein QOF63_1757 [Thermoanaerobaculia bacterium]|jgi:cellulose biosynthesis protein BcsQ|nr:hypothetical protein [Thermoanaerobaculia bacterium]